MAGMLVCLLLAGPESLESRVNEAIDLGAANLVSRQDADGSWQKGDRVHPLGRTALCTYAILHAGYGRDHPGVVRAVAFLKGRKPRSTYEAGCLLLLLHALGGEKRRIHDVCRWLVERFDQGRKLWGYPGGTPDLSNTQYAVFGLRVGELNGFRVPRDLWRSLIRGVLALQHRSGAFLYHPVTIYRASMTHAALLCLLFATKGRRPSRDVRLAMERGHRWFEKHYRVDRTPWGRGWHKGYYYYYMYGLERYGQLFGRETIGGRDWYREGAGELLERQEESGSWGSLEDTSFAILFLRKVTFTAPGKRAIGKRASRKKETRKKAERPLPPAKLPCLRRWLVAGPFAGPKAEDGVLYAEHFRTDRVAPAPGAWAGKRRWAAHESDADRVDLAKACGPGDWCAYYAATYLHAAAASEAVLWLATDDGCRVFLNGREVFEGHHHDYSGDDFYRIPIRLSAGRNTLIVKVENHRYGCVLRARVQVAESVTVGLRRRR